MVVGRFDKTETLNQDLFDWAKSSKNIIFTGRTNFVEQYLSAMDCYILPSYREGFGMGVIEAEAMGVPVIVTDIPGPRDAMVEGKTGVLIPKKDVPSLCEAMKNMLSSENLAEYSSNCVSHVKNNFDQKKFFEYVLADRKNLLNK